MRKIFIYFLLSFFVLGCGSRKKITTKKTNTKTETVGVETPTNPATVEDPVKVISPKINSTESYISTFKAIAKEEMIKSDIPASITLAQGILESGSGKRKISSRGK